MKDKSAFRTGAKPPVFMSLDGQFARVLPVCPFCRQDMTKTALGSYIDYKICSLVFACQCGAKVKNSDIVRVQESPICKIEC